MNRFYAKSQPVESIREHTDKLLANFEKFKNLYGKYFDNAELELISIAAEYHDYGKMSFAFQNKIRKALNIEPLQNKELTQLYKKFKNEEIPHGFLSPVFLDIKALKEEYSDVEIFALINAIFYHHTREINFENDQEISEIINQDIKIQAQTLNKEKAISPRYLSQIMKPNGNAPSEEKWLKYVVIKGMLNKLDYVASANNIEIEIEAKQEGKNIGEIIVNTLDSLRDVQNYMLKNKDENLVVIASTGIGKTEAALLWLGDSKGFYTLPLKVSINSIYKRIVETYKYSKEKATLLHSDALSYLINNENDEHNYSFFKYRQAKLFSYPLTICTVDQLFKFVYKYFGSEIIPATLKYSKLIIDEIQAYTPEIVAKIIYGLKIITQLGGKFAILTATFPPIFEHFMIEENIHFKKSPPFFSLNKSRHFVDFVEGDFDYEKIIEKGKTSQVLVLCNTVKKAQAVYKELREECKNVWLLHSNFIRRHRDLLEESIVKFTEDKSNNGIWVSTQIVEASLDIDFDMLFTEMATADSLLQRFGRCYRKRDYYGLNPNILFYNTKNYDIYDKDIIALSIEYIKQYCGRIFTEQEKMEYINTVYSMENLKGKDFYTAIKKEINNMKDLLPATITKQIAEKRFRDINSITIIPDEIYHKNNTDGAIDNLLKIIENNKLSNIEKTKARDQLYKLTLGINKYSKKSKASDKKSISNFVEIYRTPIKYDFDECLLCGIGLADEYDGQMQ